MNQRQKLKDTEHRTHQAGTPPIKCQAAMHTAYARHKMRTPVKNHQVAMDI